MSRPEPSDGGMVWLLVRRQHPKRHVFDQTTLDLTAGALTDRIRVDQHPKRLRRVIRGTAPTINTVAGVKRRQVQLSDDIDHEPRQMTLRQPVGHRRRHQHQLLTINRDEVVSHTRDSPAATPAQPEGRASRRRFVRQPPALRISLARRSSAFSFFNALSWADSSPLTPRREPPSISAWRTHFRSVSAEPIPSFEATDLIASNSEA